MKNDNNLLGKSIAAYARLLSDSSITAEELTRAYLHQIEENEPKVGAFLSVCPEVAIRAAKASDARRAKGQARGPLDGIPFALKDNISVKGQPMTCASHMLENYISPYNATVAERLERAGAVLLGKTNLDEFAMGSSTDYSALGITRNPRDLSCVPGGSSGGSAAAVAANEAVFTLGTDTGGSVRQPASFCGVYGFKPTWGAVSRYGVAAMASSLDCIGLLTNHAADLATVFAVLVSKDKNDATSMHYTEESFVKDYQKEIKGLRVAVIPAFNEQVLEAGVWRALTDAITLLQGAGAQILQAELPFPEQALAAYSVLSCTEAASNLGRYDGVHYGHRTSTEGNVGSLLERSRAEGFGREAKCRILFGMDMLRGENRQLYYVRAQRVRDEIRYRMYELLRECDLILTPTTTTTAFRRGFCPPPEELYYADLCTVYANLSGLPALSIPFGKDEKGLPTAIQLTAGQGREGLLLRAATLFEEVQK